MIDDLIRTLVFDEGMTNKPYKDSLGYWTIGIGHFIGESLDKLYLNDEFIYGLLKQDINQTMKAFNNIFGDDWIKWAVPRQVAVANMIFNLGETRFSKFKNTIKFIKAGDWENASKNASMSLWARQVGKRSERICYMLKFGKYPSAYNI